MPATGNIKQEKWDKNKNLTSKAFEIYRSHIISQKFEKEEKTDGRN